MTTITLAISTQKTISPVDGRVYVERPLATADIINEMLRTARHAQLAWRQVPLEERAKILTRFCEEFEKRGATDRRGTHLADGPPGALRAQRSARHARARAAHDRDCAHALADLDAGAKDDFTRFVRREPLGVVLTIAAWNYPYLIAVNSVVPALMAGNAVILKHSAQTPLCAERFAECFEAAGLPNGVFQIVHASHEDTDRIIRDPRINFVAFTGSVAGGHAVQRAAASRFIGVGLELGGCDPVYVRHDANLDHAIENIVDGAYFNSGQSCCGLQRVYVHHGIYQKFVDGFIDLTRKYVLDDPRDSGHDARAGGAHRRGGWRAHADRCFGEGGRQAGDRRVGICEKRARHAVSRAAGAAERRSPHAHHARGNLRAGRRHHEGQLRR